MNKKFRWIALSSAFLGLGLSMPSCPGQQALQQQVDALQAGQTETNAKVQKLEGQVKSLSDQLNETKALLTQLSSTVLAQKQAIDQIDQTLKSLGPKAKATIQKAKIPTAKKPR